jgi:DNA-binding Lrp family transcriptional regulator
MRRGEVRILRELQSDAKTVGELADDIDKSQGWTSELVGSLEDQHLVAKDRKVTITDTYEARLVADLVENYDLEMVLVGKREEILAALLSGPKTVGGLEKDGFATSTVYEAVDDLQAVGAVTETADGYRIADETLRRFLEARETTAGPFDTVYTAGDTTIIKTDEDAEGTQTAFSAFQRYGVDYFPNDTYRYHGSTEIGREAVLIHAVRFAENKKQMTMCGVFYLRHRATLDVSELWQLAGTWDCVERWADLLAYLDQREVRNEELFLPWDEFTSIAQDYDVYPRGKHPEGSFLTGLDRLGEALTEKVDVYLLGGANLILRDLKDTTKDIDVVVENKNTFRVLVEALREQGYKERQDLAATYEDLNPSIILEKQGFPRWDIFVEVVADALHLTPAMQERSNETRKFGSLTVHLLSLTDIFVFKSVTEREGDLEDAALIARQGEVDWEQILEEVETQEAVTDQYFSFAVLDTLDLLVERYGIAVPIRDRLASYCLENALILTLDEPKTIEDLRDEVDFPDHQIYNKLRKLEENGTVEVDRSGRLNTYIRT